MQTVFSVDTINSNRASLEVSLWAWLIGLKEPELTDAGLGVGGKGEELLVIEIGVAERGLEFIELV